MYRRNLKVLRLMLIVLCLYIIFTAGCNKTENSQVLIESIPGNDILANCYIVGDIKSGKAAIIDTTNDITTIKEILSKNKLSPEFILLTHGHFDHIEGINGLKEIYKNLPVYVHKDDLEMLKNPDINMSKGFINQNITAVADKTFTDGEMIILGNSKIEVIHTPGHTPGSVTFRLNNFLFTGDTLFKGSVGRTDFPGSSEEQLYNSIKDKLLKYPDQTTIYPGHGDSSTIGAERGYFQ